MTNQRLNDLEKRCMVLESQVASIAAFACAMLDGHPQKDVIQTRWGNHLGPAMLGLLKTTGSRSGRRLPRFLRGCTP